MLDLLFPPKPARAGPFDNVDDSRWFFTGGGPGGMRTLTGVPVNEEISLTLAAWWCGCRVLCEAVGQLPLMVYERQDDDHRDAATEFSLFDILWRAPNETMASGPFREGRVLHQINYGNGFAEIEWNSTTPARRTEVVALWPIHAGRVKPVRPTHQDAEDYKAGYRYRVKNDDNSNTLMKADEVLHVPGIFPEDGIWAKSAVQYGRETIGFGLGLEQYGSTFFGSGGQPRAVAKGLGLRDPEARKEWRKQWKELHANPTSGEIAIIPDGADIQFLSGMTNENAQYLASRKFAIAQVARILRVPVYMLEEYEKAASFASVEQRSIDWVVYGLMPWIRKWEEQCNLKLLLGPQRQKYFVEFVLAGLLRGDFASRMAGYVQALTNGIMTINEVRRLENLNSIGPAGDVNFVQLNLTTAQRMLEAPAVMPARTPPPVNGDGAQAADEFTRGMVRKLRAQGRKLKRLSVERKAALQLPPPRTDTLPVHKAAVRAVVADAGCRALTKLCKALEREAKKLTAFAPWLDAFLSEHGPALVDALEPAAAVLGDADVTGASLWARLATDAGKTLGAAFETDTPAQFGERLAGYPRQAAEKVAGEIVGDVGTLAAPATGGQLVAQPANQPNAPPVAVNVNIPRDSAATAIHEAAETQRQDALLAYHSQQTQAAIAAADARTDRTLMALGECFSRGMEQISDRGDDRMARAMAAFIEAIPQPEPPPPALAPVETTIVNNITVQPAEVVIKEAKLKVADQRVYRDEDGDMSRTVTEFEYNDEPPTE